MTDILGKELTLKDVTDLLPQHTDLIDVDYRDNLDNRTDEIQSAISTQNIYVLDELIFEWYLESKDYSIDYLLEELKNDLMQKYELDDEFADAVIENYHDDIVYCCEDRDQSNPLRDLLRHTSDIVCFYDTGFEVPYETCWNMNDDEMNDFINEMESYLDIKFGELRSKVDLMLRQASYGGRLVIYFLMDGGEIESYCNLGKYKSILFQHPMLAVIDTCNGSGDHTDLPGCAITLPLRVENIILDKTIKYNYTYEVCGMYSNWCDCTKVILREKSVEMVIPQSSLADEKAYEARCKKTFNEGGCTPGDMDIRRHREVYYQNDFPCGSHCPKCGTFWVD